MTELRGIPASRIKGMWGRLLPFVRRALEHDSGRYTPECLFEGILRRRMQAWTAIDPYDGDRIIAVLITEIINYPRKKALRLFLTAGDDLAAMLKHLPDIEAWAAKKGCKSVEAGGRRGWARTLPGYRLTTITLEKELDNA